MTHLTITQGSTAETVSTALIKKLYDIAISIPEPLQGETDNAQISGHISVGTSYRSLVAYLAGTIMYKGTGEQGNNPQGRFLNLLIDVTNTYYMEFVDSAVESVLINAGLGDGTGITENDAAAATFGSPTVTFRDNTSITSFDEFGKFTYVNLHGRQHLFYGCSNLTSIDLTLLTTTAENEFRGIGITILNAPLLSSFTGANVFNGCTNLTTILSWGSITSIPSSAFRGCTSLSTIPSLDDIINLSGSCFEGCTSLSINNLELPKLASMGTSNFKNTKITLVKCLGHATEISGFENCTQLTTVHIPYECTTIGKFAFLGCTNLSTLDQFDLSFISLNYVNDGQYTYSSPSSITTIKEKAFLNCSSLISFTFDNITTILDSAFENSGISGTVNLQNLTSLGTRGFANTNISGVQNLENIINIPKYGFYNCSSLSSISSNSVTSISDNAFEGCTNLTSISFPNCTSFGYSCFWETSNITSANINFENISNLGEGGLAWFNITIPVLNLPKITEGKKRLLGKLNAKLIYLPKVVNINNELWYMTDSNCNVFLSDGRITNGATKNIGLMYFRDIANMSACMFALGGIKHIVINNSTTPTLQYNSNGGNQGLDRIFSKSSFDSTSPLYNADAKIFVPDSAVTAYKTLFNDQLNFNVNCIHGINELDGNNNYLLPRVAIRADWDLLSSSEQEITLIEEYM